MERDRFMDLLRAVSIGVVVLGHWLMAVVVFEHGSFAGANALDEVPGLWALTWVLQVMPLFFLVGGFTNLRGWRSARRRSLGVGGFLAARLQRLLTPTIVFATIGTTAWPALGPFMPAADLSPAGEMLAKPLWFLAVYLLVIAMTPVMAAALAAGQLAGASGQVVVASTAGANATSGAVRRASAMAVVGVERVRDMIVLARPCGVPY
jgi:fucose 4-O-acetylase-like acetyltransferase